jgi:hypothetical protein
MLTKIQTMDQISGEIKEAAIYSIEAKKALVCFIKQNINHDYNSWLYPDMIPGMYESKTRKNTWYYENDDYIIQAYQNN